MMGKLRRDKGEGCITELPDGKFQASVQVAPPHPKRTYHTADTKKAANAWIRDTIRKRELGLLTAGGSRTLRSYADYWLNDVKRGRVRPNTWWSYKHDLDRVCQHLGSIRLEDIRPEHINHSYAELCNRMSPATMLHLHVVTKQLFKHALREGRLVRNPMEAVDAPQAEHKEIQVWTPDQVRSFIRGTEGNRYHELWALMLMTGLRVGEALALRWEDVDFERNVIRVVANLRYERTTGMVRGDTKTRHSRRLVNVPPSVMAKLAALQPRRKRERLAKGTRWQEHNLVFPSPVGKPLRSNLPLAALGTATRRLGLPKLTQHQMRHTAASLAAADGVHPRAVRDLLGHATTQITNDLYTHFFPSTGQDIAAKMEALLTDSVENSVADADDASILPATTPKGG